MIIYVYLHGSMYVTTVDEERDHQFEWEQSGKNKIKGGKWYNYVKNKRGLKWLATL